MAGLNMDKLRSISSQAVNTHFRHGWQFRLEVDGAPGDFDFYCKETSHTPWEIETEPFNAGATPINYPTRSNPSTISLTMRDNEDGRIYDWFDGRCRMVVNQDGTFNLPSEYLLKIRKFDLLSDGTEKLRREFKVVPLSLGELTESLDESGGNLEFPLTFIEFRTGATSY